MIVLIQSHTRVQYLEDDIYNFKQTQLNKPNITMEPTFTATASETVTAELRSQLDATVATSLPAHCLNPVEQEHFKLNDAVFVHLQN